MKARPVHFAWLMLVLVSRVDAQTTRVPGDPWPRHTIDASSRGADGVRLADVDRDGDMDVVTGWEEGGVVRAYVNPGPAHSRAPWPAVTVGQAGAVEDAVWIDLDGDGRWEVVSAAEGGTRRLFVHRGPDDPARMLVEDAWRTEPLPESAGAMQWMFTLPAQVDGRHGVDLFAGGKNEGAAVGWFEAPRDPRDLAAWRWHGLGPAGWVMSLIARDVDGDGDDDLLLSDRRGALRGCRWLENPGLPNVASQPWQNHFVGGQDHEVLFMTVADLDGDGLDDILSATRGTELLYFRRLPGAGVRWAASTIPLPDGTGTAKAVAVGDLDGDGRRDVVFSCEGAAGRSGVMLLTFEGDPATGAWTARDIGGTPGTKYDLVELLDLDGDGDLDVLTCEETEGLGVIWYENPR